MFSGTTGSRSSSSSCSAVSVMVRSSFWAAKVKSSGLQVAVHEVDLLQSAKALANVLRTNLSHSIDTLELGIRRGQQLVEAAELAHDVRHDDPRQARDLPEDPVAAGRHRIVEGVQLAVVAQHLGQAGEVEQVLVGQAADLVERDREGVVDVLGQVVVYERSLVAGHADHDLLELHLDQAALGAELDDVALDLDGHAGDELGALQDGEDVVQRGTALELQGRQAGGDLVEAGPVLVEGGQRLVGLGQHHGDVREDVLGAVDVQRDDVAALADGHHERVGLLGDALGRALAGAGLQAQDRGIRDELDVGGGDLRRVAVEDDRAVHLGQLEEQRWREVDVDLDPAGEEEAQVVGIADDEQAAGLRVQ